MARVVTSALALAMVAVCFSPLWLAAIYIVARPFIYPYSNMHITYFGGVPLSALFSVIILAAIAFSLVVKKRYSLAISGQMTFYLFVLLCIPSLAATVNYVDFAGMLLRLLTALGFAILIHNAIHKPEDIHDVLVVFALAAVGPVAFAFYQKATGFVWPWTRHTLDVGRVTSVFGLWNEYGIFLSLSLCSLAVLIFTERHRWLRMAWLILAGASLVSLVQSLNRGSWLALFVGTILAYPLYFEKVKARWLVIVFTAIALLFSSVILQRFQRLEETNRHGYSQNTLAGRVAYWKAIARLLSEYPVAGRGLGSQKEVTTERLGTKNPPHNDYLLVLLENGALGFLGFLAYLAAQFFTVLSWSRHQERWRVNFPAMVCVSYFGIILLTQNIIQNVVLFPLFMGFMAAVHRWNRLQSQTAGPAAGDGAGRAP